MNTEKIPQVAKDSIKEYITQEANGTVNTIEFESYVRSMVNCWDMHNFTSKQEAFYAYNSYIISRRARIWCRRNKFTTRKGSYHSFDGRRAKEAQIFNIVSGGAMDDSSDGVSWKWRSVDGLKNVYIWFN